MAHYDLTQLTESSHFDDHSSPINMHPSMSDDGSRLVFASATDPERPQHYVYLYDRGSAEDPRKLSVPFGDHDQPFSTTRPQISGDGRKIVFDARGYYTPEANTGIFIYDIDSGSIRLVVQDFIPRAENGKALNGRPGLRKHINIMPSISYDGQWLAYVRQDYEYFASAATENWIRTRQRLMLAHVTDARISGGTIAEINEQNVWGQGFHSLRISGNGHLIAFYAGGIVEGLDVSNLTMPPYEPQTAGDIGGASCNIYCYAVRVRGTGSYSLEAVPDPRNSAAPLIVATPISSDVQAFLMYNILDNAPAVNANGTRIALHAGFVMCSGDTGIYICEPFGGSGTHPIIRLGGRPGAGPDEVTLTTGSMPAISPDGRWLAYYRRDIWFREGYGDPSAYVDGINYCPAITKEEVLVQPLPRGEISTLIETPADAVCAAHTPNTGLAISNDADHVAFISCEDALERNSDNSHEVYYATLISG